MKYKTRYLKGIGEEIHLIPRVKYYYEIRRLTISPFQENCETMRVAFFPHSTLSCYLETLHKMKYKSRCNKRNTSIKTGLATAHTHMPAYVQQFEVPIMLKVMIGNKHQPLLNLGRYSSSNTFTLLRRSLAWASSLKWSRTGCKNKLLIRLNTNREET